MKNVNTRLTATLVVGFLLAVGTQAASAKTFVIHHGNSNRSSTTAQVTELTAFLHLLTKKWSVASVGAPTIAKP